MGAKASQQQLIETLWKEMAVEEVAMSIAHSGYFVHEPLFVEELSKGRFVVIEGNRRLAAVRLLLDANLRKRLRATKLPPISKRREQELSELPVIVTTRKESWRYFGFKHVNGPATWRSYAKAQYVAHVHNDYGVSLDDVASQIGDSNSTVKRMYRGLRLWSRRRVQSSSAVKIFRRRGFTSTTSTRVWITPESVPSLDLGQGARRS
ncbi:MAG: ParB N-terminal domain-containing protein [Acidobacteriia bacterium]|nr:ParB N-terminal domain-containing protein [Terriglobia bacterium]